MALHLEVAGYEFLVSDDKWGTIASFYTADEAEEFLTSGLAAEIVRVWENE